MPMSDESESLWRIHGGDCLFCDRWSFESGALDAQDPIFPPAETALLLVDALLEPKPIQRTEQMDRFITEIAPEFR